MDRRLPALGGWLVSEYQSVKMLWVELARSPKPTRGHWTRYRDEMSRKRGRSTRQERSGSRRPWSSPPSPYGAPGADEDIANSEDNPDDVRLTVTAKLVVRVTRPEILRKYAADAQRAMAEAHSPGDFGELAYLAVISEGLDEIAEGPAGQLRFLLNASDVIGDIRGIAIEKSDLSVEVTPRDGRTHPAAAFRLLKQPARQAPRRQAVHRTVADG